MSPDKLFSGGVLLMFLLPIALPFFVLLGLVVLNWVLFFQVRKNTRQLADFEDRFSDIARSRVRCTEYLQSHQNRIAALEQKKG